MERVLDSRQSGLFNFGDLEGVEEEADSKRRTLLATWNPASWFGRQTGKDSCVPCLTSEMSNLMNKTPFLPGPGLAD